MFRNNSGSEIAWRHNADGVLSVVQGHTLVDGDPASDWLNPVSLFCVLLDPTDPSPDEMLIIAITPAGRQLDVP